MWKLKKYSKKVAFIDNEKPYYYRDLIYFCNQFKKKLSKQKNLILILSDNTIGALVGYISFIKLKKVPIILDGDTNLNILKKNINNYDPEYVWISKEKKGQFFLNNYQLIMEILNFKLLKKKKIEKENILNSKLCLLASTSGSTGSPKFVRQSYINIKSNIKSIIKYLAIDDHSIAITTLPLSYTFGQSIINTHIFAGGKIILSNSSILQMKFWKLFFKHKISHFYGVPYTFEILSKIKFFEKRDNHLKVIAQAGGKLSEIIQKKLFKYCLKNKKKFYTMYGQAEATSRISYLPFNKSNKKIGSIGKSILNGKLYLIDDQGNLIKSQNKIGNLTYEGPNVCLGYSFNRKDLNKGDVWNGKIITGDLAKKDKDNYFYIVGRKKRYAKINGISISLDEIENALTLKFSTINFLILSDDKKIFVYFDDRKKIIKKQITLFLKKNYNLNIILYELRYIKNIPRLKTGKKNYKFRF